MRKLEPDFLHAFTKGHLQSLAQRVREDKDLDLQIRENYINIYYKGHSLLKLDSNFSGESEFAKNVEALSKIKLDTPATTKEFIDQIPFLKEEVIKNRIKTNKQNLEGEYEQLIIRANNLEKKTTSEYYIIDRQYQTSKEEKANRFDLTGFYWNNESPKSNSVVPLSFLEVKFGLNQDIQNLDEQLGRYYGYVKNNINDLIQEYKVMLDQRLQLGLYNQSEEKLQALKKIKFSKDINEFYFHVVLVDYNPKSSYVVTAREKLKRLSFAKQIRIFYKGFALWHDDGEKLI